MKKFLLIAFSALAFLIGNQAKAQLRDTITAGIQQGQFIDLFGYQTGSGFNVVTNPVDSMQVSDTLVNIIPITHLNAIDPYLTWYWQKVGSGTATLTVSFFTGNDPTNCTFPVRKGVLDSAYTRTFTLSTSQWNDIDFARDTARCSGRYLKIQLMTTNTASVGGKVYARLKTNIR